MKILVGAGPDAPVWSQDGWTCNDLGDAAALYSGITLVGPCWSLPVPDGSVDEILAKGMMEHMTYHEVALALVEWRRVLVPGGYFTGDVPDVEEYIREYIKMKLDPSTSTGEGSDGGADGEPADMDACSGIDRWLRRALWGWQRWPGDEHRSGWTEPLLRHYVSKAFEKFDVRRMAVSYEQDVPVSRTRNLYVRGWK